MVEKIAVILSRSQKPRPEDDFLAKQILDGVEGWPTVQPMVIRHLYDLKPDGPAMRLLQALRGDVIVLAWLYPRAAYWVLAANGVTGRLGPTSSLPREDADDVVAADPDAPERTIWCFDLRTHDEPHRYLEEIQQIASAVTGPMAELAEFATSDEPQPAEPESVEEETAARWYPVVDFARCTNCLECLNFCLFGVYGLDESNRILIEQPDACRAGCPACSRICPQGAIMFPQHADPAIAGDHTASLAGLKLDLSQLFGGVAPADLAAAERDRALAEQGDENAHRPSEKDQLDHLVDELDDLEL